MTEEMRIMPGSSDAVAWVHVPISEWSPNREAHAHWMLALHFKVPIYIHRYPIEDHLQYCGMPTTSWMEGVNLNTHSFLVTALSGLYMAAKR